MPYVGYSWAHLTSLVKFHQVGRQGLWPSLLLFMAVIVKPRLCAILYLDAVDCVTDLHL